MTSSPTSTRRWRSSRHVAHGADGVCPLGRASSVSLDTDCEIARKRATLVVVSKTVDSKSVALSCKCTVGFTYVRQKAHAYRTVRELRENDLFFGLTLCLVMWLRRGISPPSREGEDKWLGFT